MSHFRISAIVLDGCNAPTMIESILWLKVDLSPHRPGVRQSQLDAYPAGQPRRRSRGETRGHRLPRMGLVSLLHRRACMARALAVNLREGEQSLDAGAIQGTTPG